MNNAMQIAETLFKRNAAPDFLVRLGIRYLLSTRLQQESRQNIAQDLSHKLQMLIQLAESSTIAVDTEKANEQHYEVPSEFFKFHLGKRMKYSSCYYESPTSTLDDAEESMLKLYCERAGLKNGMRILDLGCGWGSLSLYISEYYKNCDIISISNSGTQRQYIQKKFKQLSISYPSNSNSINVITKDINVISDSDILNLGINKGAPFDIIFSIEMFEHMRNYQNLLFQISNWMNRNSVLFIQYFCHSKYVYTMETEGPSNWLGRHFFTGGTMPSDDTLMFFQQHVLLVNRWRVDGTHYSRTAEDWLKRLDATSDKVFPVLKSTYGVKDAKKWLAYWRTFYMAVAEMFAYRNGSEWYVAHYLFRQRK